MCILKRAFCRATWRLVKQPATLFCQVFCTFFFGLYLKLLQTEVSYEMAEGCLKKSVVHYRQLYYRKAILLDKSYVIGSIVFSQPWSSKKYNFISYSWIPLHIVSWYCYFLNKSYKNNHYLWILQVICIKISFFNELEEQVLLTLYKHYFTRLRVSNVTFTDMKSTAYTIENGVTVYWSSLKYRHTCLS